MSSTVNFHVQSEDIKLKPQESWFVINPPGFKESDSDLNPHWRRFANRLWHPKWSCGSRRPPALIQVISGAAHSAVQLLSLTLSEGNYLQLDVTAIREKAAAVDPEGGSGESRALVQIKEMLLLFENETPQTLNKTQYLCLDCRSHLRCRIFR